MNSKEQKFSVEKLLAKRIRQLIKKYPGKMDDELADMAAEIVAKELRDYANNKIIIPDRPAVILN